MNLIIFFAVGRLLVWTLQTSGPTRKIWERSKFLTELASCDFCMGCWIFPFLVVIFDINFMSPIYVPIFTEIVTGIAASWITHIARIGFMNQYGGGIIVE